MNSNSPSQWLLEVAKSTVLSRYVGNSIHLNVYHFVAPRKNESKRLMTNLLLFPAHPKIMFDIEKGARRSEEIPKKREEKLLEIMRFLQTT
jgi:hypothetical protein